MFKNYLKTAFRNLWKYKGFSAINIVGLAIGLSTCLLIILYVLDELSFDRYNEKANRIYRLNNEVKFGGNYFDLAQTPAIEGPTILREIPQVENYTRFRWHNSLLIKKGNENLREHRIAFADSSMFDVFTFPMISGDPKTALAHPRSLVITETIAKKYFNRTDVAGESLIIDDTLNYKITGVIKDIPAQSHFVFDIFVPMMENEDSRNESGWVSENYNTYLLLKPGVDPGKLVPQLDRMMDRYIAPILQSILNIGMDQFKKEGSYVRNGLTPLTDIHLRSNKIGELGANSSISYVYVFSAVALFILLIACVNFMNLSTARSANRAREVGVRKVLGSLRKNLIWQFLVESLIFSFIGLLNAILAALLLLPWFNNISGKQIKVAALFHPSMLIFTFSFVFVVGILAGSYPAFFLSSFRPIEVLKGKLARGFKGSLLRNVLVIFQFAVSIILIIGTMVVYNQLMYIRSKDLGYSRDQILTIKSTWVLGDKATSFKHEVLNISGVEKATLSSFLPVGDNRNNNAFFPTPTLDQKSAMSMQTWLVDEDYLATFNMKLLEGRNFSKDLPTDSNAMIINEAAAKFLGNSDLINKKLYTIDDVKTRNLLTYNIIGVVKNFNFSSLRDQVTPLALGLGKENGSLAVKMKTKDASAVLEQIKSKWKSFTEKEPFSYSFMNEDFNNLYNAEQQTGKISITFAVLAILVACLGLFGLATYAAEQRTKEIGVRKVLGASAGNITAMLSRDFVKLVGISALIAFPIAWYGMHKWLQDFAYRVQLNWTVFLFAGLLALLIALFTVSFRALKAAMVNPVRSLRTE